MGLCLVKEVIMSLYDPRNRKELYYRGILDQAPGSLPEPQTREEIYLKAIAEHTSEYYGSPLTASTVADMTDKDRVYVYTGSEAGYTAGNWYYWDGNDWSSGGVYNAVVVSTDTSLSESGEVADAKATGDAFDNFTYVTLPVEQTVYNLRVYTNTNSKVVFASNNGRVCRIYKVEQGKKYVIRSIGYDASSYDVACIGTGLITGTGQSTPMIERIYCGGSNYSTDFKEHVIEFTASGSGYLYLNEITSHNLPCTAAVYRPGYSQPKIMIATNGLYQYLTYQGNRIYIGRSFKRMGANNLLQLSAVDVGYFLIGWGFLPSESLMSANTDIIGPVSLKLQGAAGDAEWCGGNHSKTIGGTPYPTATSQSVKAYVNGSEITVDGTYYGDSRIISVNKLYAAQTVTGADLSTATQVITETREYFLTDTLRVSVKLETLENIYISLYYGMQYINGSLTYLAVPDDETVISLPANYSFTNKQNIIILFNSAGRAVKMIKDLSGLGNYTYNDGTGSYGYGLTSTYGKTYYALIVNTNISSGKILQWSGEYRQIL